MCLPLCGITWDPFWHLKKKSIITCNENWQHKELTPSTHLSLLLDKVWNNADVTKKQQTFSPSFHHYCLGPKKNKDPAIQTNLHSLQERQISPIWCRSSIWTRWIIGHDDTTRNLCNLDADLDSYSLLFLQRERRWVARANNRASRRLSMEQWPNFQTERPAEQSSKWKSVIWKPRCQIACCRRKLENINLSHKNIRI